MCDMDINIHSYDKARISDFPSRVDEKYRNKRLLDCSGFHSMPGTLQIPIWKIHEYETYIAVSLCLPMHFLFTIG